MGLPECGGGWRGGVSSNVYHTREQRGARSLIPVGLAWNLMVLSSMDPETRGCLSKGHAAQGLLMQNHLEGACAKSVFLALPDLPRLNLAGVDARRWVLGWVLGGWMLGCMHLQSTLSASDRNHLTSFNPAFPHPPAAHPPTPGQSSEQRTTMTVQRHCLRT